jgi:hypothetical protein
MDETDEAIEDVLEGKPRAEELAEMVAALRVRRETFERERASAKDEAGRRDWAARIREVDRQIELLRQEQAITEFVENSVRVTVNRPRLNFDPDDLD